MRLFRVIGLTLAVLLPAGCYVFDSPVDPESKNYLGYPLPREYPPETTVQGGVATSPAIGLVAGFTLDRDIDAASPVSLVGAAWTEGVAEEGLEFFSSADYALLQGEPGLELTTEGTVTAWVKSEPHTGYTSIVQKGDGADHDWVLQFWQAQGQVVLWVKNAGAGNGMVYSNAWLPEGLWAHVAGTWDGSILSLYINGRLDAVAPNAIGAARVSYDTLYLGAGFTGTIDEVQIYNRALDAAEINRIYLLGWAP